MIKKVTTGKTFMVELEMVKVMLLLFSQIPNKT